MVAMFHWEEPDDTSESEDPSRAVLVWTDPSQAAHELAVLVIKLIRFYCSNTMGVGKNVFW